MLELKSPDGEGAWALLSLAPIFFSYVLVALILLISNRRIKQALLEE